MTYNKYRHRAKRTIASIDSVELTKPGLILVLDSFMLYLAEKTY